MLPYIYYPGCTLKDKAKVMEDTAILSAKLLDIEMHELKEWQCCGAVFPLSEDEIITLLSPARTLAAAGEDPVVTLCSACHHVLKRTRHRLANDLSARQKVSDYLEVDESSFNKSRVLHFLELLKDDYGFDNLADKIKKPLTGKKVASYYGCMLLRPASAMQFDDPENPTVMEDFFRVLGADPVISPYRTECCGGYLSVTNRDVAADTALQIVNGARRAGAEIIATACPMCVYNLQKVCREKGQTEDLKIVYFTELLAEALGANVHSEVKAL